MPHIIGKYTVDEELSFGNTSIVYKAHSDNNIVAIKVARSELERHYFEREANIIAQLNHPNIVQLLETRLDISPPYLVLRYGGIHLTNLCNFGIKPFDKKHRLHLSTALNIGKEVASALHHIHSLGICHSDIRMYNLVWHNTTTLVDFNTAYTGNTQKEDINNLLCILYNLISSGRPLGEVFSILNERAWLNNAINPESEKKFDGNIEDLLHLLNEEFIK